jgi:hypothetical protein
VARIVLGFYMVRYPLGGMLSGSLQWLVALQRLGHDVYVAEKATWPDACYDAERDVMTDDCSYGFGQVTRLLERFGLGGRLCFVDVHGNPHGLTRDEMQDVFDTADLFVDMGTHGAWVQEAARSRIRILVDGEPGWTQMRMEKRLAAGESLPAYDAYYTVGQNVGGPGNPIPTAGRSWRPIFHPVVVDLFSAVSEPDPAAPFTTVMNWQSHELLEFDGRAYGQKDVEFARFLELPTSVSAPLEVAVSGRNVPQELLLRSGWRIRDAHETTLTYDVFREYVASSRGEFSVAKNVFVATHSGWFSDRTAAYLAAGRPAVVQETGFSAHLPCGEGLFAVRNADEARVAIEEICADYGRHASAAQAIARDVLDATTVLPRMLEELGIEGSTGRAAVAR